MMPEPTLYTNSAAPVFMWGMLALIIVIWIRDAVWKGIALWKAWKSKQLARFVCLFIFNTAGILPILYLIFRQEKESKKLSNGSKDQSKIVKKTTTIKKSPARKIAKK